MAGLQEADYVLSAGKANKLLSMEDSLAFRHRHSALSFFYVQL